MSWLSGTPGHDIRRSRRKPIKRRAKVFTVSEVAELLAVSRSTVFRYLAIDEPDLAVIDPGDWFKLPGGSIRIRARAIEKLMGVELQ